MFHTQHATPLASRMHALKLRTNRSYEALANRIGVSSSTLHRYCRGETVPSDYEVVARFGRVCGASRQEAEELLRSWALTVHAGRAPARPTGRNLGRMSVVLAVVALLGGAAFRRHHTVRVSA